MTTDKNPDLNRISIPLAGYALSVDGDITMERHRSFMRAWWMYVGPNVRAGRCLVRWEEYHASVDEHGYIGETPKALELVQFVVSSAVALTDQVMGSQFGRGPRLGTFQILIDHRERKVRFGPVGNLGMLYPEISSIGLGSYGLSLLVLWAKSHCPSYRFERPSLSSVDTKDPDNHQRRDRLYKRIGLRDYSCHVIRDLRADAQRVENAAPPRQEVYGFTRHIHSLRDVSKRYRRCMERAPKEAEERIQTIIAFNRFRRRAYTIGIIAVVAVYALAANGILSWRWP